MDIYAVNLQHKHTFMSLHIICIIKHYEKE